MWNDVFWLAYLNELKKQEKQIYNKIPLNTFLIFFCSIFCDEVLVANKGTLSGKRTISKSELKVLRNFNVKNIPNENSEEIVNTFNEMGINFSNSDFNLVLYFNEKELIGCNFPNWRYNDPIKYNLADGAVCTPLKWIEGTAFEEILKTLLKIKNNITRKKFNIVTKPYSFKKLFSKSNISNNEKLFILHNYDIIKSLKIVNEYYSPYMNLVDKEYNFSFYHFLMKSKAMIIEKIGADYRKKKYTFLDGLFEYIHSQVDENFFKINRKCRNNFHYSEYKKLTNDENEIMNKYQDFYLDNILKAFEANFSIILDWKYEISLAFAKFMYIPKP